MKGIYITRSKALMLGFNPECIDNVGCFGSTWNIEDTLLNITEGELSLNGVTTSKGVTLYAEVENNGCKQSVDVYEAIKYGKDHNAFHSTVYGGMLV